MTVPTTQAEQASRPAWQHDHRFHVDAGAAERSTRWVLWITLLAMVAEIVAGWWFNSMALLADGWHMSSHALAIGLSVLAYAMARRLAGDERFAFGTWKIEVLGAFASAILMIAVALMMVTASAQRLMEPQRIEYPQALSVAVLGLLVNFACAWILGRAQVHGHSHGHGHGHSHGHERDHGDINLRSAYLHVVADAVTSVLAIVALAGGWYLGWNWLDPVMGLLGALLVGNWARGLLQDSARVLLDREMDHPVVGHIRQAVELIDSGGDPPQITDLHVWRIGRTAWACALTVVTADPRLDAAQLRRGLAKVPGLAHSTLEIHRRA